MERVQSITDLQKAVAPIAKAHGVARIYLFGSRARGSASSHSDFDLRIDKGAIRSLIDLSNFRLDLENALGTRVDLITSDVPDEEFLKKITADEVLIYEG